MKSFSSKLVMTKHFFVFTGLTFLSLFVHVVSDLKEPMFDLVTSTMNWDQIYWIVDP